MKKSMKRDRLAIVVCATILFIAVFQIIYYHSQLPSMVASHFNLQGKPDGWSTKAAFFLMYSGIMTLLAVTFLGFHFFLPKIPVALISLPGKDYWTAPERREETCRVLASSMLWFGDIVLVYMV
ncbi:MAG: DUF1648 domain-containing protein, partial [Deltaproteobacteria bacterium]|nr:DUF1648 domain-containing protein [Deltaproteobacteria bacterium]